MHAAVSGSTFSSQKGWDSWLFMALIFFLVSVRVFCFTVLRWLLAEDSYPALVLRWSIGVRQRMKLASQTKVVREEWERTWKSEAIEWRDCFEANMALALYSLRDTHHDLQFVLYMSHCKRGKKNMCVWVYVYVCVRVCVFVCVCVCFEDLNDYTPASTPISIGPIGSISDCKSGRYRIPTLGQYWSDIGTI